MLKNSHSPNTVIGILRLFVEAWRKQNNWSRETCAAVIVEAHEAAGLDIQTGVRFEPKTSDAYARMRVNSDRIFRWLDDATKDNNLLTANMVPTILNALPMDLRMAALVEILRPLGVSVRRMSTTNVANFAEQLACSMRENSEAQVAVLALLDGATEAELRSAQTELTESIDANRRLLDSVESALQGK